MFVEITLAMTELTKVQYRMVGAEVPDQVTLWVNLATALSVQFLPDRAIIQLGEKLCVQTIQAHEIANIRGFLMNGGFASIPAGQTITCGSYPADLNETNISTTSQPPNLD